MCDLGDPVRVLENPEPIYAWKWVRKDPLQKLREGITYVPLYLQQHRYKIGVQETAKNPYIRGFDAYLWIKEATAITFMGSNLGFWSFKTRSDARAWYNKMKGGTGKLILMRVKLEGRIAEHSFGYRAEKMTLLSVAR